MRAGNVTLLLAPSPLPGAINPERGASRRSTSDDGLPRSGVVVHTPRRFFSPRRAFRFFHFFFFSSPTELHTPRFVYDPDPSADRRTRLRDVLSSNRFLKINPIPLNFTVSRHTLGLSYSNDGRRTRRVDTIDRRRVHTRRRFFFFFYNDYKTNSSDTQPQRSINTVRSSRPKVGFRNS